MGFKFVKPPAPPSASDPSTQIIYTDGGYRHHQGVGAWSYVFVDAFNQIIEQGYGGAFDTTNNRMEMFAIREALSVAEIGRPIVLFSDSQYCVRGASEWLPDWMNKGWKTAEGKPVKNQDLWLQIHELMQLHNVAFEHIKGHSGNEYNEYCDVKCNEMMNWLWWRKEQGHEVPVDLEPLK